MLLKILDNNSNAIGLCNKEGKIVYVNNAFVKLFGYDKKEELVNINPINLHLIDEIKKENINVKTFKCLIGKEK